MTSFQFSFSHPTSIVIAAQSRSAKTCFDLTFLKHSLIPPFPTRIVWFYKEWQPIYDRIKQILPQTHFSHGIDNEILEKIQASEKNLVVLDDLMTTAGESTQISKLFTQEPHHKNLTVIFIVQNVFYSSVETTSLGPVLWKISKVKIMYALEKKIYVCVKIYVCEKKNFTRRGGSYRNFMGAGVLYFGLEVVVIVLLVCLGVRKPPGGNFRRWFRIRCQNFNRTYGYGDTVIRNFAEEIFPTRLLTDPGVLLDADSESVVRNQK